MLYIFDWDGTISNSAAKIVRCMRSATRETGLVDRSDDDIKNIIGLGLPEAIRTLYSDISEQDLESVRQHYSSYFLDADVTPSPFFDGALETMQSLVDAGHQLTIATGKSRRGLDRVLAKLGLDTFFHGSRCADETASKPHPLMLQQLLEEFKCSAAQAVMIGDTEYDMAMAREIGMPRIAVSFGAHHIDRLKPYEPVMCVDHFPQILEWQSSE